MARYRLLDRKETRSVVFERSELERLDEYAMSRRRSLSSVVRDAVTMYLEKVVDARTNGNER